MIVRRRGGVDIYDKKISRDKKESLELAESSREKEWLYPSFVRELFHGRLLLELIYPFPRQSEDDKKTGDEYCAKLKEFLLQNLNPDEVDRTGEIPDAVIKGLADMGALAMKIPRDYGGLGLSQVNYNRAVHLISSYCGSTAVMLSAHQSIGVPYPLTLFGTEEQKKKYLPLFRKGAISGFALTEPGAGSDPRTMKTTATPTEDGNFYLINGEKLWCSNGNIADILVVMCLTPPRMERGKEKKQITAFIVETKTPGFEPAYRCGFMGLHGVKLGLIKFNNVRVPKENILLGEGQGLKLAFVTLNTGRLTVPAAMTGGGKWCLSVARRWSKQRVQWGHPVGEHQMVGTKLASIAVNTFAMDAVTWLSSHMADAKKLDIRLEAAMAKLFTTETGWKVVDDTFQIRGGRGFETSASLKGRGEEGLAVERIFRDLRVNLIIEGTSQIMHLFIAREAMDPHLRRIMAVMGPRVPIVKRIKAAFSSMIYYSVWFSRLLMPVSPFGPAGAMPRPLRPHIRFVRSASKRLARTVFLNMLIYQQGLESKQNIISRFVDIGMDLFVMSSVSSYAAGLIKVGASPSEGTPVELADLFCRQARERIRGNFKGLSRNHDKIISAVSKKILSGKYEWLENGIIK
ncbi:MAG: acyl-CoA dehydrogenase family protein [Candidatus Omnitrophica bacterium]|nr:acyl-CoA dehydrogenase family protein [Candidatus Omnitrophota bacterium]